MIIGDTSGAGLCPPGWPAVPLAIHLRLLSPGFSFISTIEG